MWRKRAGYPRADAPAARLRPALCAPPALAVQTTHKQQVCLEAGRGPRTMGVAAAEARGRRAVVGAPVYFLGWHIRFCLPLCVCVRALLRAPVLLNGAVDKCEHSGRWWFVGSAQPLTPLAGRDSGSTTIFSKLPSGIFLGENNADVLLGSCWLASPPRFQHP